MNPHLDNAGLNLYLDRSMEEHARAQADAHLAECAACRAELDALEILVRAFAVWRNEPIPRDIRNPVMARVQQRPLPRTRARWGIAALGAQMVLAVLLAAWALPQLLRGWSSAVFSTPVLPAWNWDLQIFSLPAFPAVPLPALSLWMWGAILAGAAILWFAGNRLISSTLSHKQEAPE